MFKHFFSFILSYLLLSSFLLGENQLSLSKSPVLVDNPFYIKSQMEVFDTSVSYTHQALLSCNPQIKAVYKVESAKLLKVIPIIKLATSSNYSCSYKEDTVLFETEKLKLLDSHYFQHEKILRLTFNDALKIKSLNEGLLLFKIDKLSKTALKYKLLESDDYTVLLQIVEKVGQSTIKLTLSSALKTRSGKFLNKNFTLLLNQDSRSKVTLNHKKKPMRIIDKPQIVALANGQFALRIFTEDRLTGNPKKFIGLEGIENFKIKRNNYVNYYIRDDLGISNKSYYYHDVLSSDFKPNTTYRVTLKKGLESYHQLKSDKDYSLKTGSRAKAIFFDDNKPYISNHGELGFSSVNIDSVTLVLERLLDDNIRYFMNFNASNLSYLDGYAEEIFSKKIILGNEKDKIIRQKFSFAQLKKNELPHGAYKVTLRYSEKIKDEIKERFVSKIVFVSDLGISLNLSKEQAFVHVGSLSKALAIKGVKVEVYGANNALLGTSMTNSDGIAVINKKELLKAKPKGIIVRSADDVNFLALNDTINSPSPDMILEKEERFKAHIYFQSKIVRPASEIHALITVKDRDFLSAIKLPMKVILRDSSGKVLEKKVYHTDEYGLIDFFYQLDQSDKTGTYRLYTYIGDKQIGRQSVKVEAFLPPKIENFIKTDKAFYKMGELIELNITSRYLFGTPASSLNGKVTFNAEPINFYDKRYVNYNFTNNQLGKSNVQSYIDGSENIKLNEKGKYSMVLPTQVSQKVPSILEAMIGVTIMDDAQPVSAYTKVKIYPYRTMVGLKSDHNSFEKGEKLEGKAILVDPLTGALIKRALYATIKEIKWHYDYSNGHYTWEKEVSTVESFTLQSNESFSKTMSSNGDYIIEVSDALDGHSASSSFDVWWWSYSNISPKNDLKSIELKFEDKLYKKGDVLEVEIKSPILEGELLLTLEDSKVQSYKLITLEKGVAKVKMPLTMEMGRGLRLHATAFRASDTPSGLIPFRAIGYKVVKADRREHQIQIETNLQHNSKSNRSFDLKIKTDKSAKLLVSVVDRGILQLVNQKAPKIFDHFNEQLSKQVAYYDLYDQLMSYLTEGKIIDFGAGDALARKKKHLAPDLGKRVKPFMLWSGVVDASNKEATVKIDVPEFNGRASVVVLAINNDSIGVWNKDFTVKDDVMLKPSYPRFILKGDKIEVPLRIFNTTKKDKNITLSGELSSNLEFVLKEENVVIPANSSILLPTKLFAKEVGKGKITLYAHYDNEMISKNVELPVYNPYALSTKTFKGISNNSLTFTAPSEYHDAKVLLSLSNNLIGALRDDLNYLVRYPYGCAEQTSSKLSAMHYAKAFFNNDRLVGESKNFIRQGIKKLYSMQNYYGEFNYWRGGSYVHPYASLYASQILLELQADGTEVPEDLIKQSIKMLKNVAKAKKQYTASYTNFHRLYAGFILAEHNALSESTANMLYEKGIYKGHFLSTLYMASIRKMQGKIDSAKVFFKQNDYPLSTYSKRSYGNRTGNFESNVRDMLLHFLIKSKYFNKNAKDLVVVQKEFSNLYSTQSKATALKAISSYLGKPSSSKLDVDISINGQKENYTKSTTIVIDKLKSSTIGLETKNGAMSYSVELIKHLPHPIKNELSSTKELSIKREFIDGDENPVDVHNLHQGDKFYSKVSIANYGTIKNVVVAQRIPACLTIVNNNIKNKKSKFNNVNIQQEYREIRDDRVLHFINLRKKEKYDKIFKKYMPIENRGVIYTPLMATSIGECKLPAVITEAMYDTRTFDYAKSTESVLVKAMDASQNSNPIHAISSKKSLSKRAKTMVKRLYQTEMNSNNPLEFVNFFHYPMSLYYRTKEAKKEDILKDKSKYFLEWKERVYSNVDIKEISKTKEMVQLQITFDYVLNNGTKILKGTSKHFLTLKEFGEKVLITKVSLKK